MKEPKYKIVSEERNLRLCIIENSIFIEELISDVIGRILDIDSKASKSFGSGSSSLSFNQKVQIILDLKGVDKQNFKKMMALMNIRNKFAHVSEIQTFHDFFTKTNVGKEVRKDFAIWFWDKNKDSDISALAKEKIYRLSFYLLIDNIAEFLMEILGNHMFRLGEIEGKKDMTKRLENEFFQALAQLNGGKEALMEIIRKLEADE